VRLRGERACVPQALYQSWLTKGVERLALVKVHSICAPQLPYPLEASVSHTAEHPGNPQLSNVIAQGAHSTVPG